MRRPPERAPHTFMRRPPERAPHKRVGYARLILSMVMRYNLRGPTPTKIVYEIPNPMVILARFQIPDQDSGFQAKILLLWL